MEDALSSAERTARLVAHAASHDSEWKKLRRDPQAAHDRFIKSMGAKVR